VDKMITKATKRLILKFAAYAFSTNGTGVLSIIFKKNAAGVIKSLFDVTYNSAKNVEQSKGSYSIQSFFDKIKPRVLSDVFTGFSTEDLVTDDVLTIEECSIPVDLGTGLISEDCLLSHLPQKVLTEIPNPANLGINMAEKLGSLYSNVTNDGGPQVSVQPISNLFSKNPENSLFNEGLDNFDIQVQLWDNFGSNLDRSGEVILQTSLILHSMQRFKISEVYLKTMH
jgi:hypothetical protein